MIRLRSRSRRPRSSGRSDRLVVRIIDDLLECIELWHSRRFGVGLPVPVQVATDEREMHAALLARRAAVIRR